MCHTDPYKDKALMRPDKWQAMSMLSMGCNAHLAVVVTVHDTSKEPLQVMHMMSSKFVVIQPASPCPAAVKLRFTRSFSKQK